jgi:hypothetical protein
MACLSGAKVAITDNNDGFTVGGLSSELDVAKVLDAAWVKRLGKHRDRGCKDTNSVVCLRNYCVRAYARA